MKKYGIVMQTMRDLGKLKNIETFIENFEKNGKLDKVEFYICDDFDYYFDKNLKYLDKLGIEYKYFDKCMYKIYLNKYKNADVVKRGCGTLKNLGFIAAFEDDCDIICHLDDDVRLSEDYNAIEHGRDYLKELQIRKVSRMRTVHGGRHFFNPMNQLYCDGHYYTRGTPYFYINDSSKGIRTTSAISGKLDFPVNIVFNHGLWENVPDLGAITLLSEGSVDGISKHVSRGVSRDCILKKGTFTTVCIMNVAFDKKVIPAYFQPPQGIAIDGVNILKRFEDIWSGFLVKKCIDSVGDAMKSGFPYVYHDKVPRNVFIDLNNEFIGLNMNEQIFRNVVECDIGESSDYMEAYGKLADALENKSFNARYINYYQKMFIEGMKKWLKLCEEVGM